MRYLIKNKKEFAISIGVFVMTLLNLIRAIMSKDITEECIVAFVLAAFTLLGWFYNMPTSKENCEMTGEMRLKKRQNKGKIDGEDFIEEPQEVDE
jgi:multisubunit Na+/H+ antiporter MnhC subunit